MARQRSNGRKGLGLRMVALGLIVAAFSSSAHAGIATSRPFLIDSTVADMQWVNSTQKESKPNAKTVFVRSARGSIYRSLDDGMNWVSQREKMSFEDDEPYKTSWTPASRRFSPSARCRLSLSKRPKPQRIPGSVPQPLSPSAFHSPCH
mmetsp:Transcript_38704/g.60369  ORF Transcript_38704/g.60369 Transcript_38704/m.60369 type:complete len:149 (+) Transcript_38704:369-815(+)